MRACGGEETTPLPSNPTDDGSLISLSLSLGFTFSLSSVSISILISDLEIVKRANERVSEVECWFVMETGEHE